MSQWRVLVGDWNRRAPAAEPAQQECVCAKLKRVTCIVCWKCRSWTYTDAIMALDPCGTCGEKTLALPMHFREPAQQDAEWQYDAAALIQEAETWLYWEERNGFTAVEPPVRALLEALRERHVLSCPASREPAREPDACSRCGEPVGPPLCIDCSSAFFCEVCTRPIGDDEEYEHDDEGVRWHVACPTDAREDAAARHSGEVSDG